MDCNLGLEHPTRTPETPKSNFLYFTVRQCFGYRESNNSFSNQKITKVKKIINYEKLNGLEWDTFGY
jgi:hypothetical protein